ncbi:hypothetical protein Pan258_59990 [Symmachiella dynata]|nr:hypothetical protein Pan258_59990 [Symmachiella dynata]
MAGKIWEKGNGTADKVAGKSTFAGVLQVT